MYKPKENYSIIQNFFVQRAVEILDRKTIDTYSTKVMNPYLILNEFVDVLEMVRSETIDYDHNIPKIVEEIEYFFDREVYMEFTHFTKDYFLTELKRISKKDFESSLIAAKSLLEHNRNYEQSLFEEIKSITNIIFDSIDGQFTELKRANEIISFLFAQLLGNGFSKSFLRQRFESCFRKNNSFELNLDLYIENVTIETTKYKVVFKCLNVNREHEEVLARRLTMEKSIEEIYSTLYDKKKDRLNKFIKTQVSTRYIIVEVEAKDAYMAFIKGKRNLSEDLDLFYFTHLEDGLFVYPQLLVVKESEAKYWNYIPIDYVVASKFNAGSHVFDVLTDRIKKINESNIIEHKSKNKINSAIRYLRLGHESKETEHKFLNYWIGLEHLFSNNSVKSSPIRNIKDYFIRLHSNNYLSRILFDAHGLINRSDVKEKLTFFDPEDYKCMVNEDLYDEILANNISLDPLLYFRMYRLKRTLFGVDTNKKDVVTKIHFKEFIKKHQMTLEQHISRMYRIRNQIVHDAAMELNIILITSNIKYYLLFTLEKIITEFSKEDCVFKNLTEFYQFNYFVFDNRFCRNGSFDKIEEVTDYEITNEQIVI